MSTDEQQPSDPASGRDPERAPEQIRVPSEASPGTPASEPADTTGADGEEPEDAWRQGIHLASGGAADADGSGQARSGYWDDEDEPERPDET